MVAAILPNKFVTLGKHGNDTLRSGNSYIKGYSSNELFAVSDHVMILGKKKFGLGMAPINRSLHPGAISFGAGLQSNYELLVFIISQAVFGFEYRPRPGCNQYTKAGYFVSSLQTCCNHKAK